ncbi:hypothetical protein BCR37DRAFT_22861 [Protomyces lactucae-debilis]|uniref:Nitrogen regulatory protein areA GATA-like domain-containing protein n=1 Tax=Protomyces lactucae-debilis TaxID=2754530 RepID=A0A1Y2FD90_PROLT|nr:uncharacterized protein BCR37DRAFT_22861 [Protomyces lactucae-debilis]ORY81890.1 hypothetical protein BCR37DRAFT_22861 [Protomyces lactucae-debilis]
MSGSMGAREETCLPNYQTSHIEELPSPTQVQPESESPESSRSSSPSLNILVPSDDIAIKVDPDRHVDYLSHEWTENDIWVSWRQVTKQKAFLQSGVRLENASWRTWAKSRNNLKTISPETLNWLKDCDVTWLYGPLHRGTQFASAPQVNHVTNPLLTPNGRPHRRGSEEWLPTPRLDQVELPFAAQKAVQRQAKPILKKRSNSEMMLARHNNVKVDPLPHTVAILRQEDTEEDTTDSESRPTSSNSLSRPVATRTYSAHSALRSARKQHFRKETGGDLPTKRRIHFNESVEQCISIIKPDPDDDDYDSQSSDDMPVMRISAPRPPINIAKLPSTTLKMPAANMNGHVASYGTPSSIFNEDDLSDDETHVSASRSGKSPVIPSTRSSRSNSTDSAILPNYDGVREDDPPPGILGRAAEVVTSARDLVSVIWSASGWRRSSDTL